MSSLELPKIIKVCFILDKNRKYFFDIDQNISINHLKKMLISAANISNKKIKLFHKEIDYSNEDLLTLDKLFPNLNYIEFNVQILNNNNNEKEEELNDLINLKLKNFCSIHEGKYPYFYCYDCKKSICSECLKINEHFGHQIKEKYDYFRKSKVLIENIFSDLNNVLEKSKNLNKEFINDLIGKIKNNFKENLIDLVNKFENKMISVVEAFKNKENENLEIIENNINLFKNSCCVELDELKNNISIEDMMIDEKIFLTFDKKLKEISNEKNKFNDDIKENENFSKNIYLINNLIEDNYKQIYDVINNVINKDNFNQILNIINQQKITEINNENIINKILKDSNKNNNNNNNKINKNINKSKKKTKKVNFNTEKILENSETKIEKENNNNNINKTNNNNNENIQIEIEYNSKNVDSDELSKYSDDNNNINLSSKNAHIICSVIPNTSQILIYNSKYNKKTRINLKLDKYKLGISQFYNNCAWENYNNKLYISGGENESKDFFVFNPNKNLITKKIESKFSHENHSMLCIDNYIYLIGGNNKKSERYNIKLNKFEQLSNLFFIQKHPILFIHENFIYSFFGIDEDNNLFDKIQRKNLNKLNYKWEPVNVKTNNLDLKMYGAGIIKYDEDNIIFLGGRDNKGLRKTAIKFNFIDFSFEETEFELEEKAYFKNSLITKIDDNNYGNFSLEEGFPFLMISL